MSGPALFKLGDTTINLAGTSSSMGGMTSIGTSIITAKNDDSLTLKAGTSIFFDTSDNNAMTITPGGSVGIGTYTPYHPLFVKGTLGIQSPEITGSNNYWYLMQADESPNVGYRCQFIYWNGTLNPKGYVSADGSWSRMNFTGQHRSLMNTSIGTSHDGLIVSATNKIINVNNSITPTISESLPYCVITNTDNDKKVFGVISNKEDNEHSREYGSGNFVSVFEKENINEERMYINSVGEGAVWVSNKNGSLEIGDYISSTTIPGYGGKQTLNEEFLTRHTVAKMTCDCDFSLTKIVKQKLKTIQTSEGQEIVYDTNGDPEYENILDPDGNIQMVYPYDTRFLQADGTLLVDQTDYETRLANGESVYIACFVGCTYHCG